MQTSKSGKHAIKFEARRAGMALFTERCKLTPLSIHHAASVFNLYRDEHVQEYLGGVMNDERAFKVRFREFLNDVCAFNWAVTLSKSDVFIGFLCVDLHHDKTDYEISFKFLPDFWGQGLTQEAVLASIEHARSELNFKSIVSETQQANQRAKKFLEKLGFQKERTVIRHGQKQHFYRKTF